MTQHSSSFPAEDEKLERLPGARLSAVQWDPQKTCLNGTRKELLNRIIEWCNDPDSERILWLEGAAGTGKSSIANSVAQWFDSLGRLAASFRFNRDTARPETPSHLIGNLAYQLSNYDNQIRASILSALLRVSPDGMALQNQARKLLVESLRPVELVGPVVIVIDALDESGLDSDLTPNRETLV